MLAVAYDSNLILRVLLHASLVAGGMRREQDGPAMQNDMAAEGQDIGTRDVTKAPETSERLISRGSDVRLAPKMLPILPTWLVAPTVFLPNKRIVSTKPSS